MSKTYSIYLGILDAQNLSRYARGIRYWICPVTVQNKSSVMFYSKKDVEKVLSILAKNKIKVYAKVRVDFNTYRYDEVDISKYLKE